PGEHLNLALGRERGVDVGAHIARLGHDRVPQLPQTTITRCLGQAIGVVDRDRLETDLVALERDRTNVDHPVWTGSSTLPGLGAGSTGRSAGANGAWAVRR